MSKYSIIDKAIRKEVENSYERFVIYPFGEDGMLAKQILNMRYNIIETAIVDNLLAPYNSNVITMEEFKKCSDIENVCILITTENIDVINQLEGIPSSTKVNRMFQKPKPKVGRYCYGPLAKGNIYVESIGSFCSFAAGSDVVPNHQLDMVMTHAFIYSVGNNPELDEPQFNVFDFTKKSIIGNDVWLGKNVIITNGAKIGNGVIAAAGAVITKDVPDYAVVAGVPAKILRFRFTKEQIEELNEIAWWDWPNEKIKSCYDDFLNIDIFLEKHSLRKK